MHTKKTEIRLKTELQPMRHLWPGIETDLVRLGINSLRDLRDRNPEELFNRYCAQTGQEHDPCIRDMFTSLVTFARTGEPRAWWRFTRDQAFAQHAKHAAPSIAEGPQH